MLTALEFYDKLREECLFVGDEEKRILNDPIRLLEPQIEMLHGLFLSWKRRISPEIQKSLIVDVLRKPNSENGKVYEALVYAWLEKHRGICYTPQVHVRQQDCFKASDKGYYADGKIDDNIIFDIKQFGLSVPHIETLRRKSQAKIPEDYYLTISGAGNISTKDLQSHFLEKTDELIAYIMNEKNKIYTDFLYRDPKFGLEFRLWNCKNPSVYMVASKFDYYKWAENNEFYFMYHASQFCINSPYILFCPYDKKLAPIFSNADKDFKFWAFRAFCRRIFMNLTKMEERKIKDYDGKARNDVSVATAARKISAIAFIDVSDDNCHTSVFLNPNADNKIPRHQIDNLFTYADAKIETFEHDNY